MKEYSRGPQTNSQNKLQKFITAAYAGLLLSAIYPTGTVQAQNQILKVAPTHGIATKEIVATDSTTKEDIIYQLALIAKKHGGILALEGSDRHILYRDSLTLYNLFSPAGSMGQTAETKVDKALHPTGKPCMTQEQEIKLYHRFKNYIEGKAQRAGNHLVRHGLIRQEKQGAITVYYTDPANKYPAVLAYRPGIEPYDCRYMRTTTKDGNCYDSAEIFSLRFHKPKTIVVTISGSQCKKWNITKADIAQVNKLTKYKKIPKPTKKAPNIAVTVPVAIDALETSKPEATPRTQEIFSGQKIRIKKSELTDGIIIVRDYGKEDGDKVQVEGKEYTLGANEIQIDTKLTGDMIVLEITSEGTQSPGTLELHRGSTDTKIAGKKGDVILIQLTN